jgi:hypothetical protein
MALRRCGGRAQQRGGPYADRKNAGTAIFYTTPIAELVSSCRRSRPGIRKAT